MTPPLSRIHLVLCFTRGLSLGEWRETGLLAREVALYQRLLPHLAGVTFVTYGNDRPEEYREALGEIRVVGNGWGLGTARYQQWRTLWPRPWSWQRTIFKSNQLMGAELPLGLARRWGKPAIVRCGYPLALFREYRHGAGSPASRQARELEKTSFTAAHRIVTTTREMADAVVGSYGIAADKVRVIPNYVDSRRFCPTPRQRQSHLATVLFVGRLDSQKNLFALLTAMAGLPGRLWLVGDGPQRADLEERGRQLGLDLTFFGRLGHEELPEKMQQADIFVLPSLYEGHPKALIEAMASGLPVVGCRVPGVEALIEAGQTGLLCQPTAESLAAALHGLMADPTRRRTLGERATLFATRNFSLDRVAEMELALLTELAQERWG